VSDLYWMTGVGAFSRRLHAVLSDLTREAAGNGREYFTPEELLLGILRAGGAARVVIELLGADSDQIIRQLVAKEQARGADPKRSHEPQVGPDSPVVRIFAQASTERRRIAEGAVGTDHVLLGILSEYRGPAYQVLADDGVGYEKASAVVERMSG
jgi:ATP-dependent Clp protease ATP-binding subunit ClpC